MSLPSTPSFRLDSARALVTGASKGIGRAGAVALAEVVLAARTLPETEEMPLARPLLDDPEFRNRTIRDRPMGRIMGVKDIMGPILFLASHASAVVSGHGLVVGGGYLTH